MKIKKLEVSDTGNEIICPGFLITEVESFGQLVRKCDELAKEFPSNSILVSLDNLGQSQYTAMHSAMANNLDETEGHDLSRVDRSAFEEGEHIGYLSTPSEFFIREENFKFQARDVTFEDACSKGLGLDDSELTVLENIHATPEMVLDKNVVAWVVPVSDPALALCASPNGYFSSDLNPFENYALASHLYKEYGYTLFGIGASCIGFRQGYPLPNARAEVLAQDITRLYSCPEDKRRDKRIVNMLRMSDFLFLKYGEELNI